jgi:hypothetical protein
MFGIFLHNAGSDWCPRVDLCGHWGANTVNPVKRIRIWKLHPAKRTQGQRTCVYWKAVYGVNKFLIMLIGRPLTTLYLNSQSVICTLTLWGIESFPAKDQIAVSLIQILKVSHDWIEPITLWNPASSLYHYSTLCELHVRKAKFNNL